MEEVHVRIISRLSHNAQIAAGFVMLRRQGWKITLEDGSKTAADPQAAVVQAEYLGKTICYDLWDGYHRPQEMRQYLEQADYYFKRSFSAEKNRLLFPDDCHKIYPLGFNYHVACPGTPFAEPAGMALLKQILRRAPNRYYSPDRFEGHAAPIAGPAKILFLTRLWDEHEPGLTPEQSRERREINAMRIGTIYALKQRFGAQFIGGLNDGPLSRAMAPDLILPEICTCRREYLKLLHSSDICIGSMGLHESIGWKTGEYIAAAKGIVNETLRYEVPGDFREGIHYLPFSTIAECLNAVQTLLDDPDKLLAMKKANEQYYREYLRPDVLVKNTLDTVKACEMGASGSI